MSFNRAKKHRLFFHLAASTALILSARAAPRVATAAFARAASFASLHHVARGGSSYNDRLPFPVRKASTHSNSRMTSSSNILESPSAERNKGPIYDMVLAPIVFPRLVDHASATKKLHVLELAAGCGVHTTHFASSFLSSHEGWELEWHPSDPDGEARASIDARVAHEGLGESIVPANGWILGVSGGTACGDGHRGKDDAGTGQHGTDGDADVYGQHHDSFDLVTCINMIHIAPWEATLGLMACAGKVLKKGGILMCYGPYKVGGTAAESNLNFDQSLRSRNAQWGVRNLEDVVEVAKKEGLEFVEKVEMPANNLSVLFRKA